jgi:hypothetical protein
VTFNAFSFRKLALLEADLGLKGSLVRLTSHLNSNSSCRSCKKKLKGILVFEAAPNESPIIKVAYVECLIENSLENL